MGARLRILTANLLNDRADPDALAELVSELEIDVAAVQELGHAQAEALCAVLGYGEVNPAHDHTGMGILCRLPATVGRIPMSFRDAVTAELRPDIWTGLSKPVEIVNVHLAAPHLMPPWRTFANRRNQLRGLLHHLEAQPYASQVLVGDFNASPAWPLYRRLSGVLLDAAREYGARRGVRPSPTWGPRPEGPRIARIDHAFLQRLEVESCCVVRIPGSDHSGVIVDVTTAPCSEISAEPGPDIRVIE